MPRKVYDGVDYDDYDDYYDYDDRDDAEHYCEWPYSFIWVVQLVFLCAVGAVGICYCAPL